MNTAIKNCLILFGLLLALHCGAGEARTAEDSITPEQLVLFNKASELFHAENYREIVNILRDEIESKEKPQAYACILYGAAQLRLGSPGKAAEAFRKGLKSEPENLALNLNLGAALLQAEKYEAAGDSFAKAARLEPAKAQTHAFTAAQCYYMGQKYAKSMDVMQAGLKSPSAKADWINLAAVNCLRLSRWKDAEHYLSRMVALEPGKRSHWKSLAYARLQQGRNSSAVAALEIASRLPGATQADRKELSGMYRRATAPILSLEVEKLLPASREQEKIYISSLLRGNRLPQLIDYLDKLITRKPSSELYLIKGVAGYKLGRLELAHQAFGAGAALPGKDSERCRMLEGMAAWEMRDWPSAKTAFALLVENGGHYGSQAEMAIKAIESMEEVERELAALDAGQEGGESTEQAEAEQQSPETHTSVAERSGEALLAQDERR